MNRTKSCGQKPLETACHTNRDVVLSVRLTYDELKCLEQLASESDMKLSHYVRGKLGLNGGASR